MPTREVMKQRLEADNLEESSTIMQGTMIWFLINTVEREAFYILARRIFLKIILADSAALKKRWPVDVSEILTM